MGLWVSNRDLESILHTKGQQVRVKHFPFIFQAIDVPLQEAGGNSPPDTPIVFPEKRVYFWRKEDN